MTHLRILLRRVGILPPAGSGGREKALPTDPFVDDPRTAAIPPRAKEGPDPERLLPIQKRNWGAKWIIGWPLPSGATRWKAPGAAPGSPPRSREAEDDLVDLLAARVR